jgi:hypothetical protein
MSLGLYEESHKHVAIVTEISGAERMLNSLLSLLGDPAQSRNLTESILRAEAADRDRSYQFSVWAYVSASIDVGKTQEALAVIEERFPGTTLEDFSPTSINEIYIQFWATVAWAHGKETSEVVARLDVLVPRWDAAVPGWTQAWTWTRTRGYPTTIAFLRGDMEEASRNAVESLSLDRDLLVQPFLYHHLYPLNVVAEQPAVAARLAEIEEQIRPRREALRAYIEETE